MFSATTNLEDCDHIVECDPDITTIDQAKSKGSSNAKWIWKIKRVNNALSIENGIYGVMFSATDDKEGDDHVVETRPDKETNTVGKCGWNITNIWNTASWREDTDSAIKNTKLKDLVIPGMHDSATYGVTRESTIAPEQDIPEWLIK